MDAFAIHPIALAVILLTGIGLFVRLVAKEKHRRDQHLLARLAEREKAASKDAAT